MANPNFNANRRVGHPSRRWTDDLIQHICASYGIDANTYSTADLLDVALDERAWDALEQSFLK
eukprot:6807498-Karenia_brevis.AAC.1